MAYATTTELQAYLGGTLPPSPQRLLDRASELIDYATFGQIDISIDEQKDAAKLSTCQQVEYWIQVGENIDIDGIKLDSISIGTYQAVYNNDAGSKSFSTLAPRARRTLFLSGMLFRGVRMI